MHHTLKSGYVRLVDRLNKFPQGAYPSRLLFEILRMLLAEQEAGLVSVLPIRPFTTSKASELWGKSLVETQGILQGLASRALLVDIERNGETIYSLPPPMAGFFEFSLMRVRHDIDQKALSELYFQYINVEEDFIRDLIGDGKTQIGRVFVQEAALDDENAWHVLDYERATHVIDTAATIGIGNCYCRHKMSHVGRACSAPMELCMTFHAPAESLIKHGFARRVDAAECRDLLEQAYAHHLVQFGENVQREVKFVCNCCGCCCEGLIAARRFGLLHPIHSTNFLASVDETTCIGCGACVGKCPIGAMGLVSAVDPHRPERRLAKVDLRLCLGCGVCKRVCPRRSIRLKSRRKRVITPVDLVHRCVAMAIERGRLQNLIFDEQILWSHRALAAVLGAIFKLPPVKRLLASKQMQSLYLETLIERMGAQEYPQGDIPAKD